MALEELNLNPGTWLAINCGSMPSESSCQVVIMAPEDQREDVVSAATTHAVNRHGYEDSDELHDSLSSSLEVVEIR
ncbi:MAG: hypothetical protein JWO35_212 [Candidatus Saccharibacteria bacterium]|nr:hypothetical protein [Candidatus Saccharibacteria bacterium]